MYTMFIKNWPSSLSYSAEGLKILLCLLKILRRCVLALFLCLFYLLSFGSSDLFGLFTVIPEDKNHFKSGRGCTRAISLEQVPKVRPLVRKHFTNEEINLLHENTPAAAVLSSHQGYLSYK